MRTRQAGAAKPPSSPSQGEISFLGTVLPRKRAPGNSGKASIPVVIRQKDGSIGVIVAHSPSDLGERLDAHLKEAGYEGAEQLSPRQLPKERWEEVARVISSSDPSEVNIPAALASFGFNGKMVP